MPEISAQINTTIKGLTREFDLIAHNLANVSTPGFKRRYNDFSKSLIDQENALNAKNGDDTGKQKIAIDFSQGSVVETGRTLDAALCGKGFFVIETPQGPLYTRSGTFRLNDNSQIVDLAGRVIAGTSGPITIPPSVSIEQISIAKDGSISGAGAPIGQFKLVDFQDEEKKLSPTGLNCFQAPKDLEPQPAENLIVKQGFQESANVQMMEELVDMIMVSRLYEANMKFLSKAGEASKQLLDVAMS